MNVSVIIPTLNEEKYIQTTLENILNQTYKAQEIIVVDGRSDDRTLRILNQFKKINKISTEKGTGRQRNIGAKSAKSDLLIFFDADVYPNKNFVQKIIDVFKSDNDLVIACPKYIPYRDKGITFSIYNFFNFLFKLGEKSFPSGAGSCIIVRRETFTKERGFREDMVYDDIEFIRRVGRKYKFKILDLNLHVSNRRFKEKGYLRTFVLYILLSVFFTFGQFKLAELIRYEFGNHR